MEIPIFQSIKSKNDEMFRPLQSRFDKQLENESEIQIKGNRIGGKEGKTTTINKLLKYMYYSIKINKQSAQS